MSSNLFIGIQNKGNKKEVKKLTKKDFHIYI